MASRTERDNERWKRDDLWHYDKAESPKTYGYTITRGNSFRYWCLTPSAAYWLAANINIHLVGENITYGRGKAYKAFQKDQAEDRAYAAQQAITIQRLNQAAAEVKDSARAELAGEVTPGRLIIE